MVFYNRQSIRLKGHDYAQSGYYFVTVCANNGFHVFGKIVNDQIQLNHWGEIINRYWREISNYYWHVKLDQFVIMPNHIHGIINIVGAGFPRPKSCIERNKEGAETAPVRLGQIIAYFKYQSTKQINIRRNSQGNRIWQRNYHERIIRNNRKLNKTREYIINNPSNRHQDEYNSHSENTKKCH